MDWNYSILDDQISKDVETIEKFFKDAENRFIPTEYQTINIIDKVNQGTNYSIRETERVKEIKLVV